VRSVRPGYGLAPKYLEKILGARVTENITAGSPVTTKRVDLDLFIEEISIEKEF
jgi:N-acetylneuraminate synthase